MPDVLQMWGALQPISLLLRSGSHEMVIDLMLKGSITKFTHHFYIILDENTKGHTVINAVRETSKLYKNARKIAE